MSKRRSATVQLFCNLSFRLNTIAMGAAIDNDPEHIMWGILELFFVSRTAIRIDSSLHVMILIIWSTFLDNRPGRFEAICYDMEFGYKLRMLGWRGYFLGPDCRSKRSKLLDWPVGWQTCRCGERNGESRWICVIFFPIGNVLMWFYITRKIDWSQIADVLETSGCFAKRLFSFIPSKFFGIQKNKWNFPPTRWNGFDFLCLLLSLVDVILIFLVLIVSQWNFSLGSASIIKATKILETKKLRKHVQVNRIRKDESWVKQFQGCKSW